MSQRERGKAKGKFLPLILIAIIAVGAFVILGNWQAAPPGPPEKPPSTEMVPTEVKLPPGINGFNLTLEQVKTFSRSKNFEVIGHSYFKGSWLTSYAQGKGLGAGFNTPRVYDGIAYLAGYDREPTLFGVLIADVRDPQNMKPLSFIPCNAGARCAYLRVNPSRGILVIGHASTPDNPIQPPSGVPVQAGFSFHDVSDPANPKLLGFFQTRPNGQTHGFEIDDRFAYTCANTAQSRADLYGGSQELVIIDYSDARNPKLASSLHIKGQHIGEDFDVQDRLNPDGTPQKVWCHEITLHKGRLYVAWRDAGAVIVDVTDPFNPRVISRLDYVPPFNGGALGASHTFLPVVIDRDKYPRLAVLTDEKFDCPPGFGRLVDISDLSNPQIISSYRLPNIDDRFNFTSGKFVCSPGAQSIHLPWLDFRSPSLLYQAWYGQGVWAWDISNPFLPRDLGYYYSPPYEGRGSIRQIREVFQDATGLIYMTDGNGGGLTVLRWTGPIPPNPPIPGAR